MIEADGKPQANEVCMGIFLEEELEKYDANLMIRKAKAPSKGVYRRYWAYVDERELRNFLSQAEMDLAEEKERVEALIKKCDVLAMLPEIDLGKEKVYDEVFIGFYPNVCTAKMAFGELESIRGGSFVDYECEAVYNDEDNLEDLAYAPVYYFFADKKEFCEYADRMAGAMEKCREDCEAMEIFYDDVKKFAGG